MLWLFRQLLGFATAKRADTPIAPHAKPGLQVLPPRDLPSASGLDVLSRPLLHLPAPNYEPALESVSLPAGVLSAPSAALSRQTDISFPARVRAGKEYSLRVQILPGDQLPMHAHDTRFTLQSARQDGVSALPVHVAVTAENFEIEGPSKAEIAVPVEGKSSPIYFALRGQGAGPGRILVDLTQNGQAVGGVDLTSEVLTVQPRSSGEFARLASDRDVQQSDPDVTLKVYQQQSWDGPGRVLRFVLSSRRTDLSDLPIMEGDLGVQELPGDLVGWIEAQLGELRSLAEQSDISDQTCERLLGDIGHRLYADLVPPRMQEMYWTLRDRGIRSLLILSDDPHIPWELVKPFQSDAQTGEIVREDGFWGETFALTHWLRGRPPAQSFAVGQIAVMAAALGGLMRDMKRISSDRKNPAEETITEDELPGAVEELEMLRRLYPRARFQHLPARCDNLRQLFEQGGFDLLHVGCHGTFGGSRTADLSRVMLEDGPFSALQLAPRMESAIRRSAPLIFFNACHSGRLGFSVAGPGSWAAGLIRLGCGGFVGPLWPVTDRGARTFAEAFYQALEQGEAIGQAMQAGRRAVRQQHPGDPTWLAYRCYANPQARLQAEGATESPRVALPGESG